MRNINVINFVLRAAKKIREHCGTFSSRAQLFRRFMSRGAKTKRAIEMISRSTGGSCCKLLELSLISGWT